MFRFQHLEKEIHAAIFGLNMAERVAYFLLTGLLRFTSFSE